jgi:hypothetical protein
VLRLTPLSLAGVGGGRGFLPPAEAATGRFDGGAGGVGLPFAGLGARAAPLPFPLTASEARGGAVGGGGGGGARSATMASSSTYAEGAQPWAAVAGFLHSHQPAGC